MLSKINLRILSAKERALLNAVSDEDLAKVNTLVVKDDVNINTRDSLERSPLMRTSFVADDEARKGMTKLFLSNGAEPNMVDLHGRSALMLACREENKEDMVKLLMQCNRTDPNLQDEDGNTALVQAIENENVTVVRTLLTEEYSHRVDVNVENFESKTAIVIAAKLKNREICSLLTSTGNVNLSDIPNHLIEYLPDEYQLEANQAKEKDKEIRSLSSKGTPTNIPSSPAPNESLSPSPSLKPQTKTDADGEKKKVQLDGSNVPVSTNNEEEMPQEHENDRSSSSNVPTSQNVDNVDNTETNLSENNRVEPNQHGSEKNEESKIETPSKGSLKELPNGQSTRASHEDKVVQKLVNNDRESETKENERRESKLLKEEGSTEETSEMDKRTNGRQEEETGKVREDGIIGDNKEDVSTSLIEKSHRKLTEETKDGGRDTEDKTGEPKEEGLHGQNDNKLNAKEETQNDSETSQREISPTTITGNRVNDSEESKLESNTVTVNGNSLEGKQKTSTKDSIDSNFLRSNTVIHKSENDTPNQRPSSIKESTEDNQAKEVRTSQQSEDNMESLQQTSDNKPGSSKAKILNTEEEQHPALTKSSTVTATNVVERQKSSKRSESRSKDGRNRTLTKQPTEEELRKTVQGDLKSTLESDKSKTSQTSQPVAADAAVLNRSSSNQSISAASFTSEPPPGVQRSPEKPRGWTAPAVATIPTAVNKWKKRANQRRGSKSHRKRPLRVEDQTPYVTKSGRVIHPNSVHDRKYEEIQEVRATSRMSRMDMASQVMLQEDADRPHTHSSHQRKNSRKMSRQGSKNTIA